MNLTISVLEGLLLLLPGLAALGAWNLLGAGSTARRPELPLTAVNALAFVLLVTVVTHLLGAALAELIVHSAAEWTAMHLSPRLPALSNPYAAAIGMLSEHSAAVDGRTFFALVAVILLESLVLVRIVRSPGVSLVLASYDLRGVGWAHRHCLEPLARGYTPVAFVMLKTVEKGRGLGYAGPIDDLRFGAQGELSSISLGQPERFVYEVRPSITGLDRRPGSRILRDSPRPPDVVRSEREWVGGVVHLAASDIHNIVVHVFPPKQVPLLGAERSA